MCGPSSSTKRAQRESGELAAEQFAWQKKQARTTRREVEDRREAMEGGLVKIGKRFSKFDDKYYDGVADQFRDYANPQVEESQAASEHSLRSALANKGKLGSSTHADQNADLIQTFAGIFRDTEMKAQDYSNQQRAAVGGAKQAAISQMYASESADAGLQAAGSAVRSLNAGPNYEPVTSLLSTAAKYANLDYNNSIYGGRSNGLFSPLFSQTNQQTTNPATSGSDVKTYNGV